MSSRNRVIPAILFCATIFVALDSGRTTDLGMESTKEPAANATIRDPDLSIWPLPSQETTAGFNESDYPLISYKGTNESSYMPLVRSLKTFINDYREFDSVPGRRDNIVSCGFDMPPPPGKVCDIDVRHWSYCTEENNFAYNTNSPCIFLRLDTPSGWTPDFYNDMNSLPEGMSSDLVTHIASISSQHDNNQRLNTVWVSCEGVNSVDKDNVGPVQYFPHHGIPGYQFLNNDAEGYLSPLVAVRFERPRVGTLVRIKCMAWARNIDHNDTTTGTIRFGLLVE